MSRLLHILPLLAAVFCCGCHHAAPAPDAVRARMAVLTAEAFPHGVPDPLPLPEPGMAEADIRALPGMLPPGAYAPGGGFVQLASEAETALACEPGVVVECEPLWWMVFARCWRHAVRFSNGRAAAVQSVPHWCRRAGGRWVVGEGMPRGMEAVSRP